MTVDVSVFKKIDPSVGFINEIFQYDVRNLESTDGVKVSQFCIALGQYLIFLRYQRNTTKIEIVRKKRTIDGVIANLLTPELVKTYRNKTNAVAHLMATVEQLIIIQDEIEPLRDELMLLDGVDKSIHELIAAFKRELTRRDNELYQTRQERK
jgi:hypothetical protein